MFNQYIFHEVLASTCSFTAMFKNYFEIGYLLYIQWYKFINVISFHLLTKINNILI